MLTSTFVDSSTKVVKPESVDTRSWLCDAHEVSPIAQRIQQVIADGRVGSARAWSLSAGLTAVHVSTYLARASAGKASLDVETALALASAAKIDVTWLVTGVGDPDMHRDACSGLPNWKDLAAQARKHRPHIPAEYFERIGLSKIPIPKGADWLLIADLAQALHTADERLRATQAPANVRPAKLLEHIKDTQRQPKTRRKGADNK